MGLAESSGVPASPGAVHPRSSGRYLSGLGASAVGLCAAGWLTLTPFAFGYWEQPHHGPHDAALTDLATGGALAAVSLASLACWTAAWRRQLRADGALPALSRRQARRQARALRQQAHGAAAAGLPDPARVLDDLRSLLSALAPDPVAPDQVAPDQVAPDQAAQDPMAPDPVAPDAAMPADWTGIPGPRSAPEAGRVPRDCHPVPAAAEPDATAEPES